MGDGFSDAKREERQARERQDEIDAFFDTVNDFLGVNRAQYKKRDVYIAFKEYDALLYQRRLDHAMRRQEARKRAFGRRIAAALENDRRAWAELLTEAKLHASENVFEKLKRSSPFAESPIVVIVPNGNYREPSILGDFRLLHDKLSEGHHAFAHVVRMLERSVKGMCKTANGWEELIKSGWDDIRFISF